MIHKRLPPVPSLREILKLYDLQASKQLSQNFILDQRVTDKYIRKIGDISSKSVLEVGPGPGNIIDHSSIFEGCLTRSVLSYAKECVVVEKDDRFLPALDMLKDASGNRLTIIQGDILKVDQNEILKRNTSARPTKWEDESNVVIVGNLPFGIATPLYINWLRDISNKSGACSTFGRIELLLMFQKEVGERIIANNNTKDFGRLSIISQNFCEVKKIAICKGKTFIPPPKVDGMMIHVKPRIKPLVDVGIEHLEKFCHILFNSKRKIIEKNLKSNPETRENIEKILSEIYKNEVNSSEKRELLLKKRAENLTVEEICQLTIGYKNLST